MEDFKLILYILAIVAYFIYSAWRKAFKTPDDDGRPPAPKERPLEDRPRPHPMPAAPTQPRQQRPAAPATSFEDILREMQSKMERANEQNRAPVEKPKPVLQPVTVAKERTPNRALSLENPEQARLYNQQRKERIAAADALYEIKKQERKVVPNIYGELLHNPQSVRQAFILSEIFNRKQY
ncbi:hypothetical protein [Pontibacter amylolyticus]|uniref:DUF4168 domain-containing protein n=1 Tax=Pontibacter amylolyticus TaxID=1424080 RepID=A0ABQ1WHG3_9BACT|nr:hypothetical protein [Pontibacter amylolyticus]GGG30005.1 hypothetical protein GCM10011323_36830 [Pontibacter amylolyticus]